MYVLYSESRATESSGRESRRVFVGFFFFFKSKSATALSRHGWLFVCLFVCLRVLGKLIKSSKPAESRGRKRGEEGEKRKKKPCAFRPFPMPTLVEGTRVSKTAPRCCIAGSGIVWYAWPGKKSW